LNAWKASGGALEISPLPKAAAATLTARPQPQRVVSADWIKERLLVNKMTLLDARPDAEFTGADGGMNGAHVKGHLPDCAPAGVELAARFDRQVPSPMRN
jgi:3-mercaptopyruvate sulfurtransferase SseA